MIERLAYGALTISASGAAVVGATAEHPYAWVAPVGVACLAALIVRGITISTPSKKKRAWAFELLVTALSVLLTGVVAYDRALSISGGAFFGMGIGGIGVGVITIGRSMALSSLRNLAAGYLAATDDKGKGP